MDINMENDMEKKIYTIPVIRVCEFEYDILNIVDGSNGGKGGDLAKERFQDLEDFADEYEIKDIW